MRKSKYYAIRWSFIPLYILLCTGVLTSGNDVGNEPPTSRTKRSSKLAESQIEAKWTTLNVYIQRSLFTKDEIKLIHTCLNILYEILKSCGVHVGIYKAGQRPFGDYVKVTKGEECKATLGYQGGEQIVQLGMGNDHYCVSQFGILHEFMHTLGFLHEEQRPDRDEHVELFWGAMTNDEKRRYQIDERDTYGIPYNPLSIMHSTGIGSKGGIIMRSKHGKPFRFDPSESKKPQKNPLRDTDIELIKKVYCTK